MVGRAVLFSAFFVVLFLHTTHADDLSNCSSKDADKLGKRQLQNTAKPSGPTKRNPCVCRHKICPLGTLCTLLPDEDGFRFL
ncbi:hypothetical protein ANCCAN_04547 [Ancylostoma caninum]|uniref:WAP domain-containing protein n=1 Tax=Ancylostoma caninum TaxID=29170 RepID=A0A368H234_ANCCA|nr:hypothetical protein ANCCAN_04547 [Ancylostoma caninum]